jgi:hypothetical protein
MSIFEVRGGSLYRKDAATAAQISFDNSGTGLIATNAQGAISEISSDLADKEDKPTVLTATLAAGATTLTFTNAAIGNNSRIRAYSNPFVLGLIEDMSQSGTTVTLTCAAQANAVSVVLEVRG